MTRALDTLVREIVAQLPDVTASSAPVAPGSVRAVSTVNVSRGSVVFAVLASSGVEIRLEPAIAAAAARTPDTAPSPRGREWVRFNPRELDVHAVDRLTAWLELASRLAGE